MENNKDILLLLQSMEKQMIKMENRIINMENKIDKLLYNNK